MAERPPATDLRGGKASEDSFTICMASLVAAYVVDFQSGLFSSIALGLTMRFEGFGFRPRPDLKTDRIRSEIVWRPVLHGNKTLLDEEGIVNLFTYCWTPGPGKSRGQALAKSRD